MTYYIFTIAHGPRYERYASHLRLSLERFGLTIDIVPAVGEIKFSRYRIARDDDVICYMDADMVWRKDPREVMTPNCFGYDWIDHESGLGRQFGGFAYLKGLAGPVINSGFFCLHNRDYRAMGRGVLELKAAHPNETHDQALLNVYLAGKPFAFTVYPRHVIACGPCATADSHAIHYVGGWQNDLDRAIAEGRE